MCNSLPSDETTLLFGPDFPVARELPLAFVVLPAAPIAQTGIPQIQSRVIPSHAENEGVSAMERSRGSSSVIAGEEEFPTTLVVGKLQEP